MAFSDEDLERLKIRDVSFHLLSPVKKDALIARLEAAERCVSLLPKIIGWADNLIANVKNFSSSAGDRLYEELDPLREAIEAWRKAAGRTE